MKEYWSNDYDKVMQTIHDKRIYLADEVNKEIERLKKALERIHYYSHVNCKAVNEIVEQALKEGE